MNPKRTSALVILIALAALAISILVSTVASFTSTNKPIVFACWLLWGVCFILYIIWSVRALSLDPKNPGVVSPSLLIKLGREHGRMYAVAGFAGYLQLLFMGLAITLTGAS